MLIDFTIKNFRSFKDKTVLSAETGERLSKYKETNTFENERIPVLKSLLIFGPNGAGKSQLFHALLLMQNMVLNGGTKTVTQRLPYYPFKFNLDSDELPTSFTIRFEKESVIYTYSFSYNAGAIKSEKLFIKKNRKEQTYFEFKNGNPITLPKTLRSFSKTLRKNALFIYVAQQQNDPAATTVFKWFAQDLLFVNPANGVPERFLQLMKVPELKHEMVSFLSFADFNITNIVVRKEAIHYPPEMEKAFQQYGGPEPPKEVWQLYTVHQVYDEAGHVVGQDELALQEESVGTQKLFVIALAMIFSQINSNHKTLLIDEFDDSLHYELSSALVKIFNSRTNNNQYLISTHNFGLLDTGVRVDQIYFVEKDFMGQSDLKSAFDFTDARGNARRDARFAKKYIEGQYGAVPVIDTENLIDVMKNVKQRIKDVANGEEKKA